MTTVATTVLEAREEELAKAFVAAWERSNHVPFDLAPGQNFTSRLAGRRTCARSGRDPSPPPSRDA